MGKPIIKKFYLTAAGKVIKITFEPTEQTVFADELVSSLKGLWSSKGLLIKNSSKVDFQIKFLSLIPEILVKKDKHYPLGYRKNFSKKIIETSYYLSPPALNQLLKDVFAYLLRKDGFLLHGSSLLGPDGMLRVFMAPSGGGKTTTLNRMVGKAYTKFSDDIVLIRRLSGGWRFFSPPFVEKNFPPKKLYAQDAEFYFLIKSGQTKKVRLSEKGLILKKVLSQIWLSQDVNERLLSLISSFIKDHMFYSLFVSLDSKNLKEVINEN